MVLEGKGYDLVIAGAGPAGLTLAWKVAERGHSVLAVDIKRDVSDVRYTVLVSFMDLQRWGLPKRIAHPIREAHFESANDVVTKGNIPEGVDVWSIDRRKLLDELEKKALNAGDEIRYESHFRDVAVRHGAIELVRQQTPDGLRIVRSKYYADCSGLGRVFERHLPIVPSGSLRMATGIEYLMPLRSEPYTTDVFVGKSCPGGYGWVLPLNGREAAVGCGGFLKQPSRMLEARLDQLLEGKRLRERLYPEVRQRNAGVLRAGRPLRSFTRGNVVYVGDVALQVNPVIGEGVRFVMDSAEMAASAVDRALRFQSRKHLAEYSKAWVAKYYHQYMAGYIAQRLGLLFLRSEMFSDEFVRALGKISERSVFRMMSGDIDYRFVWRAFKRAMGAMFPLRLFL